MLLSVHELLAEAPSLDELVAVVRALPRERFGDLLQPARSWCFRVESMHRTLSMAEKERLRLRFAFLDFPGPVRLRQPDVELHVLLEFPNPAPHSARRDPARRARDEKARHARKAPRAGDAAEAKDDAARSNADSDGESEAARAGQAQANAPAAEDAGAPPRDPAAGAVRAYFCRFIADSRRGELLQRYSLKTRAYIGPTSTSAELALVMANQALAARGRVVLDPFVGTGSLLVAAAHFGAYCIGADIDFRVLHGAMGGYERQRTMFDSFRQYGLPLPEVLCSCNSQPVWRRGALQLDAIICDPPYGVRAGSRKSGPRRPLPADYTVRNDLAEPHRPQSAHYEINELLADLLNLAADALVMRGRLVMLLPAHGALDQAALPHHPCLRLLACSEQMLTEGLSRHLLTFEKTRAFAEELRLWAADLRLPPP